MIEQEKKDNERDTTAARELAKFIKDTRRKEMLHKLLGIAARSYIDGINAALRCQQAAAL